MSTDEKTLEPVLKFAAEKQLHVIFDEIYALSLFENQSFQSMFNYQTIIDPQRTHFVWSFSKDFALSGLRLGVLYAGSKEIAVPAASINFIQVPSTIVQEVVAELLSDDQWIDWYIQLNRSAFNGTIRNSEEEDRKYRSPNLRSTFPRGIFHLDEFSSIITRNHIRRRTSSIRSDLRAWCLHFPRDLISAVPNPAGFVLSSPSANNGLMRLFNVWNQRSTPMITRECLRRHRLTNSSALFSPRTNSRVHFFFFFDYITHRRIRCLPHHFFEINKRWLIPRNAFHSSSALLDRYYLGELQARTGIWSETG